jgi:hypothetical protein
LLGLPVDQWQIGTSSLPHGIGVDHPVLVRSLDRHNALSFQDPWRRNDVWLRQHDVEPCEPALMWVAGRNAVAARQMYARLVGPAPPVGAIFSFVPVEHQHAHYDYVAIGIDAGAVALLWSRGTRDPRVVERDLRDFLARHRIGELPEAVWRYRTEAAASSSPDEHLGSSLTLFWDRYDRYPESPRMYRAPS